MMARIIARRTLAAALLAACCIPAGANGAGCVGQPGASALEQYCEAVPTAEGGRQAPGSGAGSGVSSQTNQTLQASGADGASVAALAGGAEAGSAASNNAQGGSGAQPAVDGPADPSGSPLAAAARAVSSGPTAGPTVAWALVGIALIGAASALLRRRTTER